MVSKTGGLNKSRRTPLKLRNWVRTEVAVRVIVVADSFFPLEEGRRPMGRNGQVHHGRHRGTGAFIREGLHRDNVGKDHSPAGADSNLQGRSV